MSAGEDGGAACMRISKANESLPPLVLAVWGEALSVSADAELEKRLPTEPLQLEDCCSIFCRFSATVLVVTEEL